MNTFARIRSVPHTVSFKNIFGNNIVCFHFASRADFDAVVNDIHANNTEYVDISYSDMIVAFDEYKSIV